MAGKRITGVIDTLHPALPGHFADNPLVPGVVILERVCRALVRDRGVALKAVRSVKFHAPLRPSEQFAIELAETGAGRYGFRVVRGQTAIATGSIETVTACARPKAD